MRELWEEEEEECRSNDEGVLGGGGRGIGCSSSF